MTIETVFNIDNQWLETMYIVPLCLVQLCNIQQTLFRNYHNFMTRRHCWLSSTSYIIHLQKFQSTLYLVQCRVFRLSLYWIQWCVRYRCIVFYTIPVGLACTKYNSSCILYHCTGSRLMSKMTWHSIRK